jgi:DNA-directed RNA polymerase specialized sigma24 family protein
VIVPTCLPSKFEKVRYAPELRPSDFRIALAIILCNTRLLTDRADNGNQAREKGLDRAPAGNAEPGAFLSTHWSVVLAARQPDSHAAAVALDRLCRVYWYPLYVFARRQGHGPEDARDLTQEFFAQMLSRGGLITASPERGRFRNFLLGSFRNLLTNEWKRANRQKRGGGTEVFSLDDMDPEGRYRLEPHDNSTPERNYERQWAETLLARVLERLRSECDGDGPERMRRFEVLKVFLLDEKGTMPLSEAATQLGLSIIATKGVVHRLRQRYREIFREEVANTVERPEDVDDEIRYLFRALAG